MTVEIITADKALHAAQIRELFWEYLQWANPKLMDEFGVSFDIESLIESDMQHLDKFMPPAGRLLLGYAEGRLAGVACLKALEAGMGEIKRMFVRPESRQHGLGRKLVERLIAEAEQIGYTRLRLDSARFMQTAHRLYRSVGFVEIEAYAGSEIPPEFQQHWIFMELELLRAGALKS